MSALCCPAPAVQSLHAQFVAIMPVIERHARAFFRGVRCAVRRADCVAETMAVAWRWFVGLARRGKDATRFVVTLARLAARAVRAGRRLGSQERAQDIMSPVAQRRHGFRVEALPTSTRRAVEEVYAFPGGQRALDAYEERLADNTVTPPPDAAAFRLDFGAFVAGLTPRDRRLVHYLSLGHGTKAAAARFQLSPGRVSQLRSQWRRAWRQGQGDDDIGLHAGQASRRP